MDLSTLAQALAAFAVLAGWNTLLLYFTRQKRRLRNRWRVLVAYMGYFALGFALDQAAVSKLLGWDGATTVYLLVRTIYQEVKLFIELATRLGVAPPEWLTDQLEEGEQWVQRKVHLQSLQEASSSTHELKECVQKEEDRH